MHTGVFHDLDLESDGKRLTYIGIPFSVDRSPYFQVRIPVGVVRNGDGPRLLIMAGNHGDEYEGEIALARLWREIQPSRMRGTLTILPTTNQPAVMAAKRCSPLDGGNLNRAFPGDPNGTPTARLAHHLEGTLFPRHDVVFDLHSGGTSMAHLPCALVEQQEDRARFDRSVELMRAMGLPWAFIADNGPSAPTSMAAARRAGAIGISGEFGGGGTVTPATMLGVMRAIDRVMQAMGMVERPVLAPGAGVGEATRLLFLGRQSQAIYASREGWFEPAVSLGDRVAAGDVAGWYHDLARLDGPEEPLRFAEAGIVISMRLHTHARSGDCLVQVGAMLEEA